MAAMFRDPSTSDADMPMTKIISDSPRPRIEVETTDYGLRLCTLRQISDQSMHVRVTNLVFPNAFMIPMSQEMTISQWHVPIDETTHYWYCIFTSLRQQGRQGRNAPPASRTLRTAELCAAQEQAGTITASIRTSRRTTRSPAWAPT